MSSLTPPEMYDTLIDVAEKDGKKFSFQNQKCMLTYRTHIDKIDYPAWLEKQLGFCVKRIEIAHENGKGDPNTPYEHTHIVIDFGKRFQTQNQRYFDYDDGKSRLPIHPNIKKITSPKQYSNTLKYIAKEDPECAHLLEEGDTKMSIISLIKDTSTMEDALNNFLKVSDNGKTNMMEVEALFRASKVVNSQQEEFISMSAEELNYPWQVQLREQLKYPKPLRGEFSRKLIWYVDRKGNTGKTEFGLSLMDRDPTNYQMLQGADTNVNNLNVIKGLVDKGWNGHCLFINLPRSAEHKVDFYNTIEAILDGFATSNKYEGGNIRLHKKTHLVIFANWYPMKRREKGELTLSEDRWDIRFISMNNDVSEFDDDQPPEE